MTKQPPQAHQSPNLVPNKLDTFDENFGHEESLQACAEDSIEGEHHQEVKLLDPESDEQTNSSTQSATISCSDKLRRTSRSAYGRQSSSDSCPNAFSLATLPDEVFRFHAQDTAQQRYHCYIWSTRFQLILWPFSLVHHLVVPCSVTSCR